MEFRVRRCFLNEETKSLRELYELCDNSSYNCSSYAEFTVLHLTFHTVGLSFLGELVENFSHLEEILPLFRSCQ